MAGGGDDSATLTSSGCWVMADDSCSGSEATEAVLAILLCRKARVSGSVVVAAQQHQRIASIASVDVSVP